jgi:peroxiredoxin
MIPKLNQPAPEFTLPDLDGRIHMLSDYRGRIVVVNFWSAECPHSERADREFIEYLKDWGEYVVLLSIASNENETSEQASSVARQRGIKPVLLDAGHLVADRYEAQTTPHVFIADEFGLLRYRGAFDDVSFRQREPTQAYVKNAVHALSTGKMPNPSRTEPFGCTIVRYA